MSPYKKQVISHRFRYRVWFGFLLVCAVVFCFPPWLVHYKSTYPTPFNVDWFFAFNFHFWTYAPVEYVHVSPVAGPHYMMEAKQFRHLNYCVLGIEIILLGLMGVILRGVIRRHEASLCYEPIPPVMATFLKRMKRSEQAAASDGDGAAN